MHTHTHTHTHAHTHARSHTHSHSLTYAHRHTHTRTHTHMHARLNPRLKLGVIERQSEEDAVHVYCIACVESCVSPQLSLLANLSVAHQWSLKLTANEPVHHIMTFDPSDHNYLYLMTTHHVSTATCRSECMHVSTYMLPSADFITD